jgi:hypothetical protein
LKIGSQIAMAAQVALGIDNTGQKVFAAQIDDALCIRQKGIAADNSDLSVDDCDAAFDDTGRCDDQAVVKNDIYCDLSHNLLREEFLSESMIEFAQRNKVSVNPSHRPI